MNLECNDSLGELTDFIESNSHSDEYKTMLYAADDFDDFIAFPKSVEVVDSSNLSKSEIQYLKEHGATQFVLIKCGKAFMREKAQLEDAKVLEAAKTAMNAKQLGEALKQLDGHALPCITTEQGTINYLIGECDFYDTDSAEFPSLFIMRGVF